MKKSIVIIASLIIILFINSCQLKDKKNIKVKVKYSGALKTIMSGDIQSVISLDSLNKKNLYALGAVENLKGEIQIFDSQPSNSYVINDNLQINDSYNIKASLLVYAVVEEWNTFKIENIKTKTDLEDRIFSIAKSNGIDVENPFPFLLEGSIASIDWHVINWKDNDKIHTHKKHKESGLKGNLENKEVQIIGFYSTKHKAVFTHHTTNIHLHFKTKDNTVAGHIDDLLFDNEITLKLFRK